VLSTVYVVIVTLACAVSCWWAARLAYRVYRADR
jgi:hypothetical protein